MTRSTRLFSTTTAELPALLFRSHAKNFAALGGAEPVKHHRNAVKLCKKKHEGPIQIPKHGFCFVVLVGSPCFRQRTRHLCLPSWPAFLILPLCVPLFPCCWFFFFPGLLSDAASPCHAVCAQFLVTMLVSILVSALPVLLSDDAPALWRLVSLLAPLGHAWFWMLRSSFGALSPLSVPFLSPSCLLLVSFLSPSYLRLVPLISCSAIGCCSRLPTVVDARRP